MPALTSLCMGLQLHRLGRKLDTKDLHIDIQLDQGPLIFSKHGDYSSGEVSGFRR